MPEKALVDYAYDILCAKKAPLTFMELYRAAIEAAGLMEDDAASQRRLARFYTQLSLDGRFMVMEDNRWDLRTNHLYKEAHIDVEENFVDEEEDEPDEEELEGEEEDGENEDEDEDDDEDGLAYAKMKRRASNEDYY